MPAEFDPIKFIRLAKDIGPNGGEAKQRCGIGRCYYGIFHMVRSKIGIPAGTSGAHQDVVNALNAKEFRHLAQVYKSLLKLRKEADYELNPEHEFEDWDINWSNSEMYTDTLLTMIAKLPAQAP